MNDILELDSNDNITKAELVIELLETLYKIKADRIERLKNYIELSENRIAMQLAELNKLYIYLKEVDNENNHH